MSRSLCAAALFLICWMTAIPTLAPARERVGLVLGGGGARGLVHAGVIRALEELQVPVDAIAGTSMGALIGGLYASGMDAAELHRVIEKMDWTLAFADTHSRREMSSRRKADDYDYATRFPLTVDGYSLTMPIGIIQGQQVRVLLKELTSPVAAVRDFDLLPIPFRAVATDFETGEAYVFSEGDLVTAMRASMSIPGLLAPVEHQDRLLVDGGMASNLPIEVARRMQVDRLIAIEAGQPLMKREDIDDLWAVTDQTLAFLTTSNTAREIRALDTDDILIEPALDGYRILDFQDAAAIYQIGYEAGIAMRDTLLPMALDDTEWAQYLAGRTPPEQTDPIIAGIRIEDDSVLSDDILRARIHQEPGEALDRLRLRDDLDDLYALGYWDLLDYELVAESDGVYLTIRARARGRGDGALKLGVQLSADLDRSSELNIGGSLLFRGINRRGGELHARGEVGNRIRIESGFYQPVDRGTRIFVAPWVGYEDHEVKSAGPEFDPATLVGSWRVRTLRGEVAAGLNLPLRSQLRAGVFRAGGKYLSSAEFDDGLPRSSFDQAGFFASALYDDQDEVFFPTAGALVFADLTIQRESLGASEDIERWRGVAQGAWSFGKQRRNTLLLSARAAQTFDASPEPQNLLRLGGLFNLSGYSQYALSGRQLALGVARYQRRVAGDSVLPFGLSVYLGASVESGRVWSEPEDMRLDTLEFTGSAYVAVDSPVGPIHVAWGVAGEQERSFYLTLGWPFLTQDIRMER